MKKFKLELEEHELRWLLRFAYMGLSKMTDMAIEKMDLNGILHFASSIDRLSEYYEKQLKEDIEGD